NETSRMWYYLKREHIALKNGGDPNEQTLFHGSKTNSYKVIIQEGLDHRVANLGGSIGAGIYFGQESTISESYVPYNNNMFQHPNLMFLNPMYPNHRGKKRSHQPYNHPPPPATRQMLMCRVVLGSCVPGQGGLRRPPQKNDGELHDSVSGPGMFVVFENTQSYPEYLIHF
ncbi:tankyrase-1-like, partial [Planoprotostelium fungivorum]